jgi:GNAT superfamily N-acetyltransferase
MPTAVEWRGEFNNTEIGLLHAVAFRAPASAAERDWQTMLAEHSLGWVTARDGGALVGFVNVIWDGLAHAWIQDTMVDSAFRRQGIGTRLVSAARDASQQAGCEWLHVDFDDHLSSFYLKSCGFTPTTAGLIHLN